jgi:uncharacterized RDD family membrane protein YckC
MAYAPPRDPTNVVGRRVVAYVLDVILLSAIVVAILAATKSNSFTGAPDDACKIVEAAPDYSGSCVQLGSRVYTWDDSGVSVAVLVGLGAWVANLVVLQGITGASIGKMITGLRTVNEQGEVCGIGKALVRSLVLIVDSLFCGLVGLITVLSTQPHKRVGDMVAKTFVVAAADSGTPIGAAPRPPSYAYAAGSPGWGAPPASPQPGWGAPESAPPPGSAAPASHWAPSQPVAEPEPEPPTPAPPPASAQPPGPAAPSWAQPPPAKAPPPPPPEPPSWAQPSPQQPPPSAAPPSWGTEPPPVPAPETPTPAEEAEEEEPPQAEDWWNRPGG